MKKIFGILMFIVLGLQFSMANEYVTFAKMGKVYHLIDQTGETISKQPMTKVMNFYKGYASVMINKKWHYLDQKGNAFTVDMDVDKLHAVQEGFGAFMSDKKWGFMNLSGEVVISPQFESVKMFNRGKCWVKRNDKWFQINSEGVEVFSGGYDKFHFFNNGVARVKQGDFWGYINEAGEEIAGGIVYDDCEDFVNNLAFVEKGDLWGMIDEQGAFVLEPQFSKIYNHLSDGYAFVRKDEMVGVLNSHGKLLVEPIYEKIERYREGFCGALRGDKWEVLNREGAVIVDGIDKFTKFQEGYAVVRQGEQYAFLTTEGEMKLLGKYDDIKPFVNGFALVKKGDYWGYVNASLEEVIPAIFLAAKDFNSDWTIAKTATEKWGYINQTGDMVIEAKFDNADYFVRNVQADVDYGCNQTVFVNSVFSSMFSKTKVWFDKKDMVDTDIARVKYEGNWAFINKEGEFVLSGLDNAETWINGFARFRQSGEWGVINIKGEVVIEPHFDKMFEMFEVCE